MESLKEFLFTQEYLGNRPWQILLLLCSILAGLLVGRTVAYFLEASARRMKKDDRRPVRQLMLICLARPVMLFLFFMALSFGLSFLTLTPEVRGLAAKVVSVLYAVALGYAIYRLVDVVDYYLMKWAEKTESRLDDMLVPMVRKSLRITIGVIVTIFIIQNFFSAERILPLLGGLGVGGLAVALAAQDTIKNFFGSFMIIVDKPFHVGDRIRFAGYDGPVEQVGFRTTRLRTLEGHQVTIPNSKISDSAVENVDRRPHIRRVANITITYDTPPDKVRRGIEIIKEILDNHEGMSPDYPPRVYFSEFNDASLNILVYYWYHPGSWWNYLEFTHKVNMQILERFNAEGIEFAFPTQTLYLANDEKRQLAVRVLDGGPGELPKE
jgi:MscS family membrane protein